MQARFGFAEESPTQSLEATVDQMAVTRELVRQIQCKAMDKLREHFEQNDHRTLMSVAV